ncbi:MAG: hypothetical protein ABSG35_13585 [Syntrophobacteraceae bacterium]|jgi:hypothetical protein
MGRKKKPEPDDPEQSARFIETAKQLGLVENPEKALEDAFKKIAKAPRILGHKKDSESR